MKILVVDDDNFNLTVVKGYLVELFEEGEIYLCQDPMEAEEIIEQEKIDICLLDILMPVISGVELLKVLRNKVQFENMQIIMLTQLNDEESFKECFELGVNDWIRKPIDRTEFLLRVKAAVKARHHDIMLKDMYEKMRQQNQELILLNQKLNDIQLQMRQKEKLAAVGELAAGVAHEINNPITFVGSNFEILNQYMVRVRNVLVRYRDFMKMLDKENTSEDILNELRDVQNLEINNKLDFIIGDIDNILKDSWAGIERVVKIVSSLKTFTRISFEDEKGCYSLNDIISEALLFVKNEAKPNIEIETKLLSLPLVLCNKIQICQVAVNILINAIQAIKDCKTLEQGKILIETFEEEDYLVCRISDNGPGVSENVINNIFDPFFTTKEVGHGTGLGLSISYEIITKNHGGEISVENMPQKGAIFTFKIPNKLV